MSDSFLDLQKVRIRGLGSVVNSEWFDIGRRLTLFAMPRDFDRKGFFSALQTLNPPYPIDTVLPFQDYPLIQRDGKYQKRVRPDRRTISMAIFIANPKTVRILGEITPHLYETDRIEVGRKLNYSRWINFVEIASTSRWGETNDAVKNVAKKYGFGDETPFAQKIASLKPTDRIKDETMEILEKPLVDLLENASESEEKDVLQEILFIVQRQRHFSIAKTNVEKILPCFHYYNDSEINTCESESKRNGSVLQAVKNTIDATLDKWDKSQQSKPIFLFDEAGLTLNHDNRLGLRKYVEELSGNYQCLYMLADEESVVEKETVKVVRFRDLFS